MNELPSPGLGCMLNRPGTALGVAILYNTLGYNKLQQTQISILSLQDLCYKIDLDYKLDNKLPSADVHRHISNTG